MKFGQSIDKDVTVEDLLNKYGPKEAYIPTHDEAKFITQAYRDYLYCRNIKNTEQEILGGVTLLDFWNQCSRDYDVIVDTQDENDPVTPYSSPISRDKSNAFISNLTLQLLYPSVIAQNPQQEIDRTISKISRSLLEWAHNNDGRPSMSGQQKSVMYTHEQVIKGTVHVMDNFIDGRLESQFVPNEEIFIPNFFQPDIQKQPYLFRAQTNIVYEEAERLFGHLPRFKYVIPGLIGQWVVDAGSDFAEEFQSLIILDRVHIIHMWRDIPKRFFKFYNVPKNRKTAKLYNVMINGVLMFKQNNLMPYEDGLYPISKGIFEHFSDTRYYWGNSMPGKAKHDKKWLDGWKTLIRHKAKLAAIPPYLTLNGKFLDADIFIPGGTEQAPSGFTDKDIMTFPDLIKGVTGSDVAIYEKALEEINLGNLSPQAAGAKPEKEQTATLTNIMEENAQKILGSFGQQVAFLVEARTYPILRKIFQFVPRQRMAKIVVADQNLGDGKVGSMEVTFKKLPEVTQEELLSNSFDIRRQELEAERAKQPKKIVYVDPSYLRELDLYIVAVADPMPKKTTSYRIADAMRKFQFYKGFPDEFNAVPAAREAVRALGDDENEIINSQPVVNPAPGQQGTPIAGQPTRLGAPKVPQPADVPTNM